MNRLTLAQCREAAKEARAECLRLIPREYKWKRSRMPVLLALDANEERLDRLMVDFTWRMSQIDEIVANNPEVTSIWIDSGVDFAETKEEMECDYGIEYWQVPVWSRDGVV